jgi:hypothetical protein
MLTKCLRRDARRVRLAKERALPLLPIPPVMQYLRTLALIHVYVLEGNLLELDGHIGWGTRCEAEVVGESVAGVGRRGFCGVNISGGSAGAIASASAREPLEEWFEKNVNRKGERASPYRVPRLMSIDRIEPHGVI